MHLKRDLLLLLTVSQTLFLTDNCIYTLNLPGFMILFIFFIWTALQPFEVVTLRWAKFSLPTLQNFASFCTHSFLSRSTLWSVHFIYIYIYECAESLHTARKKKQIKSSGPVKAFLTYGCNLTSDLLQDCIMLKV